MPQKKFKLTRKEVKEIKWLRQKLTTKELLAHINANRQASERMQLTAFRKLLYEKNIKKCRVLRWTEEETAFLLANYKTAGNKEIAEKLSKPGRIFTKKNIEKKMILLNIHRSKDELQAIRQKHKESGVYARANSKRWKDMKLQEGDMKIQIHNGTPVWMIKISGKLRHYARYRYIQLHGDIPKGYKVYFKDLNPMNINDDNLIIRKATGLTQAERQVYAKNVKRYFEKKERYTRTDGTTPAENKPAKKTKSIPVRINDKTVIYIKPGTDIEALKRKLFAV